ncbi:MAG TPA: hypothetical protein DCZ94_08060 [Lentisphaeria bacterium]|nr:MAG: hypothetical protein A2X48_19535 [Lentisphaerae bacterium GWF2_49_21]HBC86892.1 hypothetical protein [Lentisphaeria bacterium]
MLQKKILITGASGLIGKLAWGHLSSFPGKYDLHGLDCSTDFSDHSWGFHRKTHIPENKFIAADISDYQKVTEAVRGMDTVIQLAANPSPYAKFEDILASNIKGLYNVFEASRAAGVKRIIYASSIRVSEGYYQFVEPYISIKHRNFNHIPEQIPLLSPYDPVRPTELYGASKVFGESVARIYSDIHGISCICLRIGLVSSYDVPSSKQPGIWCSHRDIAKIIQLCVDAPETLMFDVFYCLSGSRFRWIDTSNIRDKLGYVPSDNEDYRKPMLG